MATAITPMLESFTPRHTWLRNGHVQTLVGNFFSRRHMLPNAEEEVVRVEEAAGDKGASSVLCHCNWQPENVRAERLTVVLVHGLEGSSSSHYMLGNAAKAWHTGCNVVRMNMRGCGGSGALAPTVYHCGLSNDVGSVVEHCIRTQGAQRIALVGYSMGGNLVLRYVALGGRSLPRQVVAAVGVSPVTDIGLCSDALHEWRNRIYEVHFLRGLLDRFREKAKLFPHLFDANAAKGVKTLRQFDEHIVARYAGFAGADDYYARCGSGASADSIAVPTLVLHASDDPFVRMSAETREKLLANPHVEFIETEHGGHCAFFARPPQPVSGEPVDNFWAEHKLLRFLLHTTPMADSGRASTEDAR